MNDDRPDPRPTPDLAALDAAVRASAGCTGLPPAWFFPEREEGADNHGGEAKKACRLCPVREDCLRAAVLRNEPVGIWGGAGEARRRRVRAVTGTPLEASVVAAHFRQLDGAALGPHEKLLLQVFGAGATHGRRSTQAKGCRCEACLAAASFDGAVKALQPKKPRRPARAPLAVAA